MTAAVLCRRLYSPDSLPVPVPVPVPALLEVCIKFAFDQATGATFLPRSSSRLQTNHWEAAPRGFIFAQLVRVRCSLTIKNESILDL